MRPITPLLAASLFVSALPAAAVAQEEDAPPPASVSASAAAVPSYIVQLTVFPLKSASDPSMTAGDIVQSFEQLKKDDKLDLIETVRLSTLAGHESLAQFGKKNARNREREAHANREHSDHRTESRRHVGAANG